MLPRLSLGARYACDMDAAPEELAPRRLTGAATWLLTQAASYASRLVAAGFAVAGSRGYHYRLLAALQEYGPASQAALSRRTGVYVSDVVAAVNELVAEGLVERSVDASDRRRNVIILTGEGRRRLRQLDRRVSAIQDEFLSPLAPDEREQFMQLLERLLEYHGRRSTDERRPSAAPKAHRGTRTPKAAPST